MRAVSLLVLLMGFFLGGCGNVEWFPDPPSVAAFSFSPASVVNVPFGSTQTSNQVTLAMDVASADINVSGGEYSKNGGAFTTTAGTVVNGDRVAVRHTAGSTPGAVVTTTLTVGGKSATFSSTTEGGAAPFTFSPAAVLNVSPGSVQTSNVADITVTGTASISVTGGSYSLDGGPFTTSPGTVTAGAHQIQLQHTAADGFLATTVTTTVTIGGTSASFISSTANVADAVVEASGAADTVVTGAVTLHLVSGTYTIQVLSSDGIGAYSLNGADGDYQTGPQTVALTDGQTIHLQDFAFPGTGSVSTTFFAIDGGVIEFRVITQ